MLFSEDDSEVLLCHIIDQENAEATCIGCQQKSKTDFQLVFSAGTMHMYYFNVTNFRGN